MAFPTNAKLTGMVNAFQPDKSLPAAELFTPETSDTRDYAFDIVTHNTGILPARNPDGPAGIVKLTTKDRIHAKLHVLREKKHLPASLIKLSDAPGKRAIESFNARLAREMEDFNLLVDATWEYHRWKLMTSGTLTFAGEDPGVYEFGLKNSGEVGADWDVPASSTPISDLKDMAKTVRRTWGVDATEVLMTSEALIYLMASAEAAGMVDDETRREFLQTGSVKKIANLSVRIIDNGYTDGDGDFHYFLSDDGEAGNVAIVKAPGPVGLMVTGPAIDEEAPDGFQGKFVKSWSEKDPSGRWALLTQTAAPGLTMSAKMFVATLW